MNSLNFFSITNKKTERTLLDVLINEIINR